MFHEREQTRLAALANGHYFIVWGLTVSIGIAYGQLQAFWPAPLAPLVVWAVIITFAWLYTSITIRRERRASRIKPHRDGVITYHWVATGISMTLLFMGGGMWGAIVPGGVPGLMAVFLAPTLIVNARATGLHWMVAVGGLWWVAAIALFTMPVAWRGLALAACLFALFVIPGAVLLAQARRIADRTA